MLQPDHSHLVRIGDSWPLWKWFRLRGAGFPARWVEGLSAPATCAAIERLFETERAQEGRRRDAVATLERLVGESQGEARKSYLQLLRKVRRRHVPDSSASHDFTPLRQGQRSIEEALLDVDREFQAESESISAALQRVAEDRRFQEAVVWQNLDAYRTGIRRVIESNGRGGKKHRRAEQMVSSYLQRYCVKNDTIGFFGPQGIGEFSESDLWSVKPGSELLKHRKVYFEHWAISALADHWTYDHSLRLHARPRLLASMRLEGPILHHGYGATTRLPAEVAAILASCDGQRSAHEVARFVLESPAGEHFDDEDDIYEILEDLHDKRVVSWTFTIPTALNEPERYLEEELRLVPDAVAENAIRELEQLVSARDEVGKAAGDPVRLASALDELNRCFESVTEQDATRAAGQMYAGRTLVFEECMRDLEFRIAPSVVADVSRPLALLLQSARWFTSEVARRFSELFRDKYESLCNETGRTEIGYMKYWESIKDHFGSDDHISSIVAEAKAALQARWAQLLGLPSEQKRLSFRSEDLEIAVQTAFAAARPGWPAARYHSPDLMIVEPPTAERGAVFVLGEIHAAVNTCGVRVFQSQCENADELIEARKRDLPGCAVVPVISRSRATRADHVWMAPHHVDLESGDTPSWRERESVMQMGSLVVQGRDGELVVRDRVTGREFSLIEVLETSLSAEVAADFRFLPGASHQPRIEIDSLIIGRESWTFAPDELTFAGLARGVGQFVAARRWAKSVGLPSRVFVKIPEETKPVYVDLASPIYVEILARLARQASIVVVSEMLPDLEHLWLADAAGNTFTSELRVVAVDPVGWERNS